MIEECKGHNGRIVGSKEYFDAINHVYLKGLMERNRSRNRYYDLYREIEKNPKAKKYSPWISNDVIAKDIKKELRKMFEPIANIIVRDLSNTKKENRFIKDENSARLITALDQLKLCGIASLDRTILKVKQLSWYIDVDEKKVKKLQRLLNELGFGPLSVTGIYDEITDKIWMSFIQKLETGEFVKLASAGASKISTLVSYGDTIRIVEENKHYFQFAGLDALVNNLNKYAKVIKIGNKIMLASSIVLDLIELGLVIQEDLTDADKKIGKKHGRR